MVILNVIGLFALLALPAIIAIHLFRRRFRPRPVTGLFLYGPGVKTVAAGRTPQRILWHASLLAEILAALALAWYLIDPHFSNRMFAHHDIVVLDSRWRMAAEGPAGSVDEQVRTVLANRIAALSSSDRVTIITSGATPSLLCGPAARPDVALRALATWKPERPWHDLAAAVTLAHSLAEDEANVIIFSDHKPEKPEPNCEYIALGQPLLTSGIADVRWWNDEKGSRIVARVVAFGGKVERDIAIMNGSQMLAKKSVVLPNDQPIAVVFPIADKILQTVSVSLLGKDPLPQDDVVSVNKPPQHGILVRLKVDGKLATPLTRGLSVISGVTLLSDETTNAHLVITDKPVLESTDTWILRFDTSEAKSVLGPFLQHRGHPLLRGLDYTGVLWSGALPIETFNTSKDHFLESPLLMAGPAILVSQIRTGRDYEFRAYIDIAKSSLTNHPSWPALLDNIISMRRAALPGCAQTTLLSSQTGRIILPPKINSVTLTRPSKELTTLQADTDGVVIIPPSDSIGPIDVTLAGEKQPWLTMQVLPCDARMADLRNATQKITNTSTKNRSDVERARSMLEHILPIILVALCAGLGWIAFQREEGRAP